MKWVWLLVYRLAKPGPDSSLPEQTYPMDQGCSTSVAVGHTEYLSINGQKYL